MGLRWAMAGAALALLSAPAAAPAQAPPAPAAAAGEARLQVLSLTSAHLKGPRALSVYLPPGWREGATYPVIYMSDGQAAAAVIRVLDPMIRDGRLPPVLLIGLFAAADGTERHREYLPRFDDPADRAFNQH